ncbi:Hypothetical protein FKW44_024113 [Caligus rogercresseyi]|uniref:Uncharacterized protein n=1 Tax=Caligus rogercresseyi TaxID=217165 RepID=A0A7T8GLV3_CALRO|nr:Hypothetical protein FKW44_024624 [Caligus rogercresseyi]QQP32919.1 Hypothetical protein FKW44_024113 [Caligus rogercresseyi]
MLPIRTVETEAFKNQPNKSLSTPRAQNTLADRNPTPYAECRGMVERNENNVKTWRPGKAVFVHPCNKHALERDLDRGNIVTATGQLET